MEPGISGLPSSTLGGTKFKIQQSVPSGSIKKGPHAIVRTADLNDGIEIKRRFGEGSKPLFSRDDVTVNQPACDRHDVSLAPDHSFGCNPKLNRRSYSTESSSPERYRHHESKKHLSPASNRQKSPGKYTYIERPNHNRNKHVYDSKFSSTNKTDRYKRRDRSKSRSPSPVKKKPVDKVPYYRDEQREKDRLRRLYGYSRSRSPPTTSGKKDPKIAKRRFESPSRRRAASRERHCRHSPYRGSRRDYRRRRSRTRSRTRSPLKHERSKHSSRNVVNSQKKDSFAPQYIAIPVPVPPDYAAYSFPGWIPTQPHWHPSPHRPPPAPHFAPYPIWPMIPPIRPPHRTPYVGIPPSLSYTRLTPQYHPLASQRHPLQRHNTNNYQSRPKKPSS